MNTVIWTSPSGLYRARLAGNAIVWDVRTESGYQYTHWVSPAVVSDMAWDFYQMARRGQRPTEKVVAS